MELEVPDMEYGLLVEGDRGRLSLPGHPLSGVPPHMSGETE